MSRDAVPILAALAAALILTGCAGNQPLPDDQLNVAEAAMTEAGSAGARGTAPDLLDQAGGKIAEARDLIEQEEYARARRLLEQATAEARLAGQRARTAEAKRSVKELNESIDMLDNRMTREQT